MDGVHHPLQADAGADPGDERDLGQIRRNITAKSSLSADDDLAQSRCRSRARRFLVGGAFPWAARRAIPTATAGFPIAAGRVMATRSTICRASGQSGGGRPDPGSCR